jgi:cyclic pyranopterin phosphate synthase
LGFKPKLNCVVIKNINDDELINFVDFAKERDITIRFIEYMPFDSNGMCFS